MSKASNILYTHITVHTSDSKSNTLLSELIWHVLPNLQSSTLSHSFSLCVQLLTSTTSTAFTAAHCLNRLKLHKHFCSCTTWFLDMDDLVRINRTWLHKEPKVSVLHANAKLIEKGECWTWNQRFRGSILTWGNILLLEFTYWEKYRCNRKVQ